MANKILKTLENHSEKFAKIGVMASVAAFSITAGRALLTTVADNGHDLFAGYIGEAWRVFFYIFMGSAVFCLGVSAVLIAASAILYSRRVLSSKSESHNG